MHAWEQIQQTIEYIETHLGESIQIEKLADMAALSPFYYQRLFSRLVHKPVAEYIKLRRMAKAVEELAESKDKRILDIALELGFTSHEHFTRTFKSTFGMTPEDYRKNPKRLSRMTKPELILNYVLIDEGVPLITEGIVLEVRRQKLDSALLYIGMEKEMPVAFMQGLGTESGEDPLDTLWCDLHEVKASIPEIDCDGDELGVAYQGKQEGYFAYFAGGSAKKALKSDKLETWELPAGEYVVCYFEAENFDALVMDALFKAEQYLFNVWLPNHKITTEAFCAERYARHDADAKSMEVWLKICE